MPRHTTKHYKKKKSGNVFFFFFFFSPIKHCVIRVGILALYMIRHLHLISENYTQMELMRYVMFCPSLERIWGSKSISSRFHQFAGYKVYCSYMGAQFLLLLIHLAKISRYKRRTAMIFKPYKSVLATTRQQMLRLFSALYTNISLYIQHFLSKKKNAVLI